MSDEQFTQTPAFRSLCAEFGVPADGDAAAYLSGDEQERFFQRFDELKQG